jgi:hypothetical protein
MPHEGPHQSWLRVTPELLAFALSPEHDVLLRVDLPRDDSMVVLQMTAHDARLIAEAIIAKAKEAEAARAAD